MPLTGLSHEKAAGALLTIAFLLFAVGAALPLLGRKGNAQIFTLPVREHLRAVRANTTAWRWANVFMGAAVAVLLSGLTILTTVLEQANERVFARLGLIGFVVAAVLWIVFSAFRASTTITAAVEAEAKGDAPLSYALVESWAAALFRTYITVGCVALAIYGASLLHTDVVAAWAAWTVIALSAATLAHLLASGDTLPGFHYFPPLLIGILLLVGG